MGPVLTTMLFANLPEPGTLTRKEVAALAGAAPFPRDSGTLKGRRTIWGGRAHVRAALYMATLVVTRKNPVIWGLLPALVSGGEGEEARLDGVHAEATHNSQCDGEEWHAVAGGGQSARVIFKTVADHLSVAHCSHCRVGRYGGWHPVSRLDVQHSC